MPDPTPSRKPVSRLGLYIPYALAAIVVLAWSGAWVWARNATVARIDAGATALRKAGYELSWRERSVSGYPLRLNVTLTDVSVRDRSGWALSSPRLEGQTYLHAPKQWLVAAPDGLTFVRPRGGPVQVTGRLIRASISHPDQTPPSVSFEGTGLVFTPANGAQPFGLTGAERVEIHLRRAPAEVGDEGGFWVMVQDGRARLSGLLERMAGGRPVQIAWDSRFDHASALRGDSWADAVKAWTAAGGRLTVKRATLTAGDAVVAIDGGALTVATDGHAQGTLPLSLRQAPRALEALEGSGVAEPAAAEAAAAQLSGPPDLARATLTFDAGRARIGPAALWNAPRIYGED